MRFKLLFQIIKMPKKRKMKIIFDGKRVRKEWFAWYEENQACFKKEVLKNGQYCTNYIIIWQLLKDLNLKKELKKRKRTVMPEPSCKIIKNYVGKWRDNYD